MPAVAREPSAPALAPSHLHVVDASHADGDPQPAPAFEALCARDASVSFALPDGSLRPALAPTSLSVRRGEFLCLIGPSGCGKSTLLNLFGGLLRPTGGTVLANNNPVLGPRPDEIAYVFQDGALFPWSSIYDNIATALEFQGVPRLRRDAVVRKALAAVGLTEFMAHFPDQLSGGMRQRAALARALALDPDILLMDEPFAALDEQTRLVLGEDLSVLLSTFGKTIVFVTHSLSEAVFLADRVAVFSARPGHIKEIIEIDEPHPRKPAFSGTEKFSRLRNRLYELLREEIVKTIAQQRGESSGGAT